MPASVIVGVILLLHNGQKATSLRFARGKVPTRLRLPLGQPGRDLAKGASGAPSITPPIVTPRLDNFIVATMITFWFEVCQQTWNSGN
jgi:hypothetical protein